MHECTHECDSTPQGGREAKTGPVMQPLSLVQLRNGCGDWLKRRWTQGGKEDDEALPLRSDTSSSSVGAYDRHQNEKARKASMPLPYFVLCCSFCFPVRDACWQTQIAAVRYVVSHVTSNPGDKAKASDSIEVWRSWIARCCGTSKKTGMI